MAGAAAGAGCVGRIRGLAGEIEVSHHDGVEQWVERGGAGDAGVEQFAGGEVPGQAGEECRRGE